MGANESGQNGGEYSKYQTGIHEGGRHCQNAGTQRSLQQMCQRFSVSDGCHKNGMNCFIYFLIFTNRELNYFTKEINCILTKWDADFFVPETDQTRANHFPRLFLPV